MTVDFEAAKDRAIKRLMQDGAARYIDLLIEQVDQKIEPTRVFTKAELIELLRGTADGMRRER